MTLAIQEIFHGVALPRSFTATTIVLLPKGDNAQRWGDIWPISLFNITNKIVTKIIARCMKNLLRTIISPSQICFVSRCHIADNILMAQEMVRHLNYHSRSGNIIFMLDMAKVYGHVHWEFLLDIMLGFGFAREFCLLILRCLNSYWFSININGVLLGFFKSHRGLRQGDPLSPMLFIIAAEYLSRSLDELFVQHPSLHFQIGSKFRISHLLYADDIIIFCNGLSMNVKRICQCLFHYEEVSGQLINSHKSSFLLPSNAPLAWRTCGRTHSGFSEDSLPMKYLGAPLFKRHRIFLFSVFIDQGSTKTYWLGACDALSW